MSNQDFALFKVSKVTENLKLLKMCLENEASLKLNEIKGK